MLYSSASGDNALQETLTHFIRRRMQEDFGAPATKKAEEIQKAKQRAFKDGIAIGLAGMVNDKRRELYRALPLIDEKPWLVPIIYDSDAFVWLKDFEDTWENGAYKDATDADMWKIVEASFNDDLVRDDRFELCYATDRRRCIMEGLLDPEPEDREWLEQEVDKHKVTLTPVEAALAKLQEVK